MIPFSYARATTVKGAIDAIRKDPSARFIAGGTNLVDLMKRGVMSPEKVIDITGLPTNGISNAVKGKLRIGAGALNATAADHPLVLEKFPLLSQALKAGASPQIRNMATVGGNLMQRTRCPYFYDTALPCNKRSPGSGCSALRGYNRMHAILGASENCIAVHPSDMAVALAALDAVVVVAGPAGERNIPILDFHRLPGSTPELDNNLKRNELIIAVDIPERAGFAKNFFYTKVRDRASYAFALVSAAVAFELDKDNGHIRDVHIAMGGVAHKPWRFAKTEAMLRGQYPNERLFNNAIQREMDAAKSYGHNDFKIRLARNTLLHTLKTASGLA